MLFVERTVAPECLALWDDIAAIGGQLMPIRETSLLIQGSFDESGKLNDSEIVAFGGCVGTSAQMSALLPVWSTLLEGAKLDHTSMKEAMHFRGTYEKWKDRIADRDSLLRALARLVIDSKLMIVATPMTSSDFKALPPAQQKKFGGDLQYCGFEACVSVMLHALPGASLHILCDLSEEYSEKCVRLFHKLRNKDALAKKSCYALTFADDERLPGLQAADMIAYCARAEHLRASKQPEPIIDELISILGLSADQISASFSYRTDEDGLGHGFLEGDIPKWKD